MSRSSTCHICGATLPAPDAPCPKCHAMPPNAVQAAKGGHLLILAIVALAVVLLVLSMTGILS
jgi:predicted nucleic acid-binding Zn ribbon protein